jgi:hypothetical protein
MMCFSSACFALSLWYLWIVRQIESEHIVFIFKDSISFLYLCFVSFLREFSNSTCVVEVDLSSVLLCFFRFLYVQRLMSCSLLGALLKTKCFVFRFVSRIDCFVASISHLVMKDVNFSISSTAFTCITSFDCFGWSSSDCLFVRQFAF